MNVILFEELVRRKTKDLQSSGLTRTEAATAAGREIMKFIEPGLGCASKFCMRMVLEGAKKRILGEASRSENMEGEKAAKLEIPQFFERIMCYC
ncbi:hypothetical protein [Maridesulfovibrio bastinii]|uniref:hypothetical protein n=1 Tax=Maridesulfovibrio bastinii TaxID=47157 RepID=UPI00041740CF|nr:hypothetical protein [Maridesulfovibrio bastinii]